MSRQTISQLKSYFETGDVPTQTQFEDLIDSTFNATSGLNDTNGFANLSVISLSANEIIVNNGVSQSLTVSTPSGTSTITISNGIITNIS